MAFLLIFLCACSRKDEAPQEGPAREVSAIKVSRRDVPISIEFVGQTKGSVDAEVRARVSGVLTGIHFEEGREVKEGQLLYSIDPAPFKAKVSAEQGKLSEAETKLAKADSDLKRAKPLAAMKAISERDLDAAVAQYGAAQGAVDAAKGALESARIELGYCEITAPASGVIGLTKAKVGEFVGTAPNPVVLNTVSALDPINVRFALSEREYLYFANPTEKSRRAERRQLEMILADESVYPLKGEVKSLDREIDPKTGTIIVEASFPNPDLFIRPGQFAKVRTTAEIIRDAIVVPKQGLRQLQGQYQAFVIGPDNKIEVRNVKRGQVTADLQIIEEGLDDNDVIAIDGLQMLKAGMQVRPLLKES